MEAGRWRVSRGIQSIASGRFAMGCRLLLDLEGWVAQSAWNCGIGDNARPNGGCDDVDLRLCNRSWNVSPKMAEVIPMGKGMNGVGEQTRKPGPPPQRYLLEHYAGGRRGKEV